MNVSHEAAGHRSFLHILEASAVARKGKTPRASTFPFGVC